MSVEKVYLCPSCQAVVKSETGSSEGVTCGDCGFQFSGAGKPVKESPVIEEAVKATVFGVPLKAAAEDAVVRDVMKNREDIRRLNLNSPAQSVMEMALKEGTPLEHEDIPPGEDEVILKDGTRKIRRRKRKKEKEKHRKIYFFLTLWLGISAAIVAVIQLNRDSEDVGNTLASAEVAEKKRNFLFFQKQASKLGANFRLFRREGVEEADRLLEIDYSSQLASNFSTFHQGESLELPVGKMGIVSQNVIELASDRFMPAVELLWRDERGRLFETVQVWDGKNWKLDWEHYARFSSFPWTLFRTGQGKKEGVFRLWVRKRKTLSESSFVSLLFYEKPRLDERDPIKMMRATESPEVIVKTRSDLGREILSLFQKKEEGKRPYDSIFGQDDPSNMIRVTVRLAWEPDDEGEEMLVLKDILGISWYGTRIRQAYQEELEKSAEMDDAPVFPIKSPLNEEEK